MKDWRWVLPFC